VHIQYSDSGRCQVDTARVTLTGAYARSCGEQSGYYSLLGHREYVAALFAHLWRDLGGVFSGRVRDGTAASDHAKQTSANVRPLADLGWEFAQRAGAKG